MSMNRCSTRHPDTLCSSKNVLLRPWQTDISCQTLDAFALHGLNFEALKHIQKRLPIVFPWNANYPCGRGSYNRRYNFYPLGIIYCTKRKDVQRSLLFCQEYKFDFSVRSSGHSNLNYSLSQQIVIDLSLMNRIKICSRTKESKRLASEIRADRFVEVGPRVRLGVLLSRLSKYNLMLPTGTCSTVCVSGLTMGGGISPFAIRKSGMTCDHLIKAEVILANGSLVQASSTSHSDLLFALKGGGGGNFGIVTKFVLQPCPFFGCVVFRYTYDWSSMAFALSNWQTTAPFADTRLSSEFILRSPKFSPGSSVECKGQFEGTPEELKIVLTTQFPWTLRLTLIEQEVLIMPTLSDAARYWKKTTQAYYLLKSVFWMGAFSPATLNILKTHVEKAPGPLDSVSWNAMQGQVAQSAFVSQSAFPWRKAWSWNQISGRTLNAREVPLHDKWVTALYRGLLNTGGDNVTQQGAHKQRIPFAYVNVFQTELIPNENFMQAYYGPNATRLRQIKTKYDPTNVFHFAQSIPTMKAKMT